MKQRWYTVCATITHRNDEGLLCKQMPTFFLGASVQGIKDEAHARRIVEGMLNPFGSASIEVSCSITYWEQ